MLRVAAAYHRMGQFDNAVSDYSKAIEISPSLAVAYQNRGSAYYQKGQIDAAMPDYNKAIELNPGFSTAYQDRGEYISKPGPV